jgi:uncharacterized lipoprotein YddW (UPF0748 family)
MQKLGTAILATLISTALLAASGTTPAAKPRAKPKSQTKKSATPAQSPPAKSSKKVASKPSDTSKPSRAESADSRREELRGIWIPTDQPREWEPLMKKLKDSGLNAAFVRVAQGGKAIYPSNILPQDQWSADTGEDEFGKAVAAAHKYGIQIHAWKVCFPMGAERNRPPGSDAHAFFEKIASEDRLVRTAQGKQTSWLNPADPRNQDLEVRVAGEIAQMYAIDGYHLDYIRYPASSEGKEPGYDAHYDNVARREFEKSLGRPVKNWPDEVSAGALKMQYEDWERDNITRVVKRIRAEVKSKRPGTLLSAAVWRKVHLYRTYIKQDWPRWCREGLLDFVIPMCYERDLDEFRNVLARDFGHVCGRVPFMAGIGSYLLRSPDSVVDQVQAARELGADGFVLFSVNDPTDEKDPKKLYKGLVDRQLAALAAGATKTSATPGVGGPHLEFLLSNNIITRRYQYFAAESGEMQSIGIRLPKTPGATGELRVTASVEDLKGRRIGDTQSATLKPGGELAIPIVPAIGAVRPVVRGTIGQGTNSRPFVLRGPIVEPISSTEMADLHTRIKPAVFNAPGTKVGVYVNGLGSDAILDSLRQAKGIAVAPVDRLEASHLAPLDVLILPQLFELAELSPAGIKAIRMWVEGGGRIIVTRDAVGLRWHPRLFPEVGVGTALVKNRTMQVNMALRGMPKGTRFEHEFKDHAEIEIQPNSKVLLTDAKTGKPVAAIGKLGKGTVILNGLVPGNDEEAPGNSQSMHFLLALVNYR